MFEKIFNQFTWESAIPNIVYGIIGNIILMFIIYLCKLISKLEVSTSKFDLINKGQLIGLIGAVASVVVFVLMYILGSIDKIFTIESLARSFLICYGVFLLLHLLHGIFKGSRLEESIVGIIRMIFFTSIFLIILLYLKTILENLSGLTLEQIDYTNKGLIIYLQILFRVFIISGSFITFNCLLNFFKSKRKKTD